MFAKLYSGKLVGYNVRFMETQINFFFFFFFFYFLTKGSSTLYLFVQNLTHCLANFGGRATFIVSTSAGSSPTRWYLPTIIGIGFRFFLWPLWEINTSIIGNASLIFLPERSIRFYFFMTNCQPIILYVTNGNLILDSHEW